MAYIKERGNNDYFVRESCGTLDNGRPFQKSRLFRPSRVNLPESKLRKELDTFIKALGKNVESNLQPNVNSKPILGFVTDPTTEGVINSKQAMPTKRQKKKNANEKSAFFNVSTNLNVCFTKNGVRICTVWWSIGDLNP